MAPNDPPSSGILETAHKLADTSLGLLHNRLELFAVDLQEQRVRLMRLLILVTVAIFLANLAAVLVAATIIVLAGESARVYALIGMSLLVVAAVVVAFLAIRKELRSAPPPFQGTLAELQKDREWLNSRK
jgi:uncharacterized membrane protein YqjE